MTKQNRSVHSCIDDHVRQKTLSRYTKAWMERFEPSASLVNDCHYPPRFLESTTGTKGGGVPSFLTELLVPQNYRANMFSTKESALFSQI